MPFEKFTQNTRRVGIELVHDEAKPHLYRIRFLFKKSTWVISAMAFMTYIGFDYSGDRAFPLYRDDETGLLVFDLATYTGGGE